jgi:hypothetical protein
MFDRAAGSKNDEPPTPAEQATFELRPDTDTGA